MAGRHEAVRRPKRERETSDVVAAILRMAAAYGRRIGDDPVALAHVEEIEQGFSDAVNLGVFLAGAGTHGYSQREMARLLTRGGKPVSQQAIQQRVTKGRTIYAEMARRMGAGALISIHDVRARRARKLAEAGVPDRTGSVRELRAVGE